MNFRDLNLQPPLMEGVLSMGFSTTTPVQEKAIPEVLAGRDIIACAQTGTGKTGAFLIPIINLILTEPPDDHQIKALIIVPTRELALQIDQQLEGFSYFTDVSSIAVYGGGDGSSFSQEKNALTKGADIVICTPGRMLAHLQLDYVVISRLKYLVLDEADRMLDMGFHEDILQILSYVPEKRQNMMFSATMPPKIRTLSNKVLHDPAEVSISVSRPAEKIAQVAFSVYENQKIPLVKYLLKARALNRVLIFCSTKSSTKELARDLKKANFDVAEIHSDLDQKEREDVMRRFKGGKLKTLVATDVLSRGIDVENIELVMNFDVPNDGEDYIHRIGRTARAETAGIAFTLISEKQQGDFLRIEELLGYPVKKAKVPDQIGPGPEYKPRRFHRNSRGPAKRGKQFRRK